MSDGAEPPTGPGGSGSDAAPDASGYGIGARLALAERDNFLATLEARPHLLTEATARSVREAAAAAERLALQRPSLVSAALEARMRSAWMHEVLGRSGEAAADHLRRWQFIHQFTDDVDGYAAIADGAREVADLASRSGRDDLVREAVFLAADTAYWSATKVTGPEQQEHLLRAYRSLTRLAPLDPAVLSPSKRHGLVTLSAALCQVQSDLGPPPVPALSAVTDLLGEVFEPGTDVAAILRNVTMRAAAMRRSDGRTRLSRLFHAAEADEVIGAYLIDELASPGRSGAAVLEAAELGSARTLLDGLVNRWPAIESDAQVRQLSTVITAYPGGTSDDLLRRELELVSALPFGVDEEDRVRRREAVGALDARARELGREQGFFAITAEVAAVQALLGPDEVLVRYVLPQHPLHPAYLAHAVVVTRTETRLVPLSIPESDGSGMIGSIAIDGRAPVAMSPLGNAVVMARLAAGSGLPEAGADPEHLVLLDEMILEPVRATGLLDDARHLVIVPQRSLHLAPWMALRSRQGRWLIDDASVTLAPSLSVWARLRERPAPPVRRAVVVGAAETTMAGLEALPGSARQVETLEVFHTLAGVDVRSLTGSAATLERMREALSGAQLLDIATHGSFPDTNSLFDHAFHLTPDLRSDGRVTAEHVRSLHLDGACVVLGVCNGGAYRVGPGDEPYGLVPAFLEAGAVNVVAAQWPVPDEPATDLLVRVGTELPRVGAAEALRLALLETRDQAGEELAAWLGFACVGDGQAPVRG